MRPLLSLLAAGFTLLTLTACQPEAEHAASDEKIKTASAASVDWSIPQLSSNVWKISKAGQPDSYLAGTIHIGKKTFHFGSVGKGSGAKLVLNSLLGIFGEAYSEAMLMARQFGIDTDTIIEAVGGSAMDSPMFQTKKSLWANREFPPAFALKHASKDLNLAVNELKQAGNLLPAVETVAESYCQAVAAGYGEQDVAGVYLKLAEHQK